jgi:hypothetical protein
LHQLDAQPPLGEVKVIVLSQLEGRDPGVERPPLGAPVRETKAQVAPPSVVR